MTDGTKDAILAIRKAVAETTTASPGECLAGVAHELGFLIAFLSERGEEATDLAHLVDVCAEAGGDAYREAKEAQKNAN
jgi:hypothetical protein